MKLKFFILTVFMTIALAIPGMADENSEKEAYNLTESTPLKSGVIYINTEEFDDYLELVSKVEEKRSLLGYLAMNPNTTKDEIKAMHDEIMSLEREIRVVNPNHKIRNIIGKIKRHSRMKALLNEKNTLSDGDNGHEIYVDEKLAQSLSIK